jgi:hypothetical protein
MKSNVCDKSFVVIMRHSLALAFILVLDSNVQVGQVLNFNFHRWTCHVPRVIHHEDGHLVGVIVLEEVTLDLLDTIKPRLGRAFEVDKSCRENLLQSETFQARCTWSSVVLGTEIHDAAGSVENRQQDNQR